MAMLQLATVDISHQIISDDAALTVCVYGTINKFKWTISLELHISQECGVNEGY